jgi:hypothetical protein
MDGVELKISNVEWQRDRLGIRATLKCGIDGDDLEQAKPQRCLVDPVEQAARRRDLIEFAKQGAPLIVHTPPALMAEGNVSDHAWVDNSSTYTAVLKARAEHAEAQLAPARSVPRMVDQKPWSPLGENIERPGIASDVDYECSCHKRMGMDFYFKPARMCFQGLIGCDKKPTRPKSLNDFAAECHRDNQHWWHDPSTGEKLDRNMGEMLMLVVSEIAECMEGERKGLMDTHLPHRPMPEVELADAYIRLLDIAGSRVSDLDGSIAMTHGITPFASDNKGAQLLRIAHNVAMAQHQAYDRFDEAVAWSMKLIEMYAEKHGYDLWGAVAEKREYNKHRADHKPEARLAVGGKKF